MKTPKLALLILLFAFSFTVSRGTDDSDRKGINVEVDGNGTIIEFAVRNYDYQEVARIIAALSGFKIETNGLATSRLDFLAKDVTWDDLIWGIYSRIAIIEKVGPGSYRIVGRSAGSIQAPKVNPRAKP